MTPIAAWSLGFGPVEWSPWSEKEREAGKTASARVAILRDALLRKVFIAIYC